MRWPRIIFYSVLFILLAGFAHYTLPQRDIVRVADTEIIRQDFSGWNRLFYAQGDSGNAQTTSRDLRLINTISADGTVRVYRNEDTGFGWPPYFKFDSADLHAEAANLISNAQNPQWVAITHYGWRSRVLTTYANAVSLNPVSDPTVRLIPWFNIAFLIALALFVFFLWRIWERFEDRVIDPLVDRFSVQWAKLKDRFSRKS